MGAVLQQGDIVASRKPIPTGRNGNVILVGTHGIVVGKRSGKIAVQFEKGNNETSATILCFRTNLRRL